jgi:cytosine/adenosine deaminase-related metal-dependent hydrolase
LASTDSLSLWDEMRFAKKLVPELKPADLLRMVTLDAAAVLGLSGQVGSLESGKKADYLIVNVDSNLENVYQDLLESGRDYRVQKVVVQGRTLKSMT